MKLIWILFLLTCSRGFSGETGKLDEGEEYFRRFIAAKRVIIETGKGIMSYKEALVPNDSNYKITGCLPPRTEAMSSCFVIDLSSKNAERRVTVSFSRKDGRMIGKAANAFLYTGKGDGVISLDKIVLFKQDLITGKVFSDNDLKKEMRRGR